MSAKTNFENHAKKVIDEYLDLQLPRIKEDCLTYFTYSEAYVCLREGVFHNLEKTGDNEWCLEIDGNDSKTGNPVLFYFNKFENER